MSRDSCQLCPEITHCPRYHSKRPPEMSPGAVFMPVVNGFVNVSPAYRLCGPGSCLTFQFRLVLYGAGTRFR